MLSRHRNLHARREEAIVASRSSQHPVSPVAHGGSGGEGGDEVVRSTPIDMSLLGKGDGGGGGDAEEGGAIDKAFVTSIRGMVDDLVTQAHTAKRVLRERRRPAGEGLEAPQRPHPHTSASDSRLGGGGRGGAAPGGRHAQAGGGHLYGMGEHGAGENGASEVHLLGPYAREGEGEGPSSAIATRRLQRQGATRRLARPASAAAILPKSQLAGQQQRAAGIPPWLKGAGADWLPRYGAPRYAADAPPP